MTTLVLCREIRKVEGGYIVEERAAGVGFREVVCRNFAEVVQLLGRCSGELAAAELAWRCSTCSAWATGKPPFSCTKCFNPQAVITFCSQSCIDDHNAEAH